MRDADSTQAIREIGISLEPLRAAICSGSGVPDSGHAVPPTVLVPRLPGEPFRLESSSPLHPRGTGDLWPPEATLDQDNSRGHGPRIPLAVLWPAFAQEQAPTWRWTTPDGDERTVTPTEALAGACAAVMPSPGHEDVSPVLVIPNHLRMSRQQDLIDACGQHGLRVKLLWRPIAAAIAWCEQHAASVLKQHPNREGSIGTLLSVHLGLDEFEITSLELVIQKVGTKRWLLPARVRPDPTIGALPSCGIEWLLDSLVRNAGLGAVWHQFWTTAAPRDLLLSTDTALQAFLDRDCRSDWRASIGLTDWLPKSLTRAVFDVWLKRNATASDNDRALGAVITGEFAQVSFASHIPLWRHVVSTQRAPLEPSRVLLEAADTVFDPTSSLLAQGAALHARHLANEEPSYLDTLPRMRTVTYLAGKPGWLDLLKKDDDWVPGGRTWQRPEPLTGLSIQEGRSELEVVLWHDEFPTVRKLKSEFKEATVRDEPVQLEVSVESAQGNARLEVVPVDVASGLRRMRLEWKLMSDTGQSPDDFLRTLPTLFPPLLRRAACRSKWDNARVAMQVSLSSGSVRTLSSVVTSLQQRDKPDIAADDIEARATAISSEGEPGGRASEMLNRFVTETVKRLLELTGDSLAEAVRALGYTSTPHPEFQQFLAQRIKKSAYLVQHELSACGWCLRDPAHIAAFAAAFARLLRSNPSAVNNWLKAFAEMLRYREDATRDMSSKLCEELTERILVVFAEEHEKRNFNFLFRNSCLCIVYLLRRRAYDDDYLPPGSPLNDKVRTTFLLAKNDMQKRGIGGAIKLDCALQTMIDYIKRQGPSVLTKNGGGLQVMTES